MENSDWRMENVRMEIYSLLRHHSGSACVNIELAASLDKNHSMSRAISSISKTLRRRKNKCVLFTQVADTKIAFKFWKGKLTQTKRASAMNGLLANFDQNHEIYTDTTDMAIFFD
jgi:hypothetical protein